MAKVKYFNVSLLLQYNDVDDNINSSEEAITKFLKELNDDGADVSNFIEDIEVIEFDD